MMIKKSKYHNFEDDQNVIYNGIEAIIVDSYTYELMLEIRGLFGKGFYYEKVYKNKFLELLGIAKYVLCDYDYMKNIKVSYYNIKAL